MNRGIVMIAMGSEYEKLAAATIRASLPNISVPLTIIFNTNTPVGDWVGLDKINKIVIPINTDSNREIKVQLYRYTPYDKTLYIDVDSVIRRPGIEKIFDRLLTDHIVFQQHNRWEPFKKYYDIYRRAMKQFDCHLPINIMIGGFFAFRKTSDTRRFFDLWLEYWEDFGRGRDMPPLACAIQNSGIRHSIITRQTDKLFSFGFDSECIAIHRMKRDDLRFFNIPEHIQNKPFDKGNNCDWTPVYFESSQNEWLIKKTNIELQDKRERAYIHHYFSYLRCGGKRVLDLGCGFGQFLLVCRRYGNGVVGIVPPLEKYKSKRNIDNSDSLDYELFCRERLEKNRIKWVECDIEKTDELRNVTQGEKFDVINCKHAINLIFRKHFDFKRDISQYKNDGVWIIDNSFRSTMNLFFDIIRERLNNEGVLFIASLNSVNVIDYSREMISIGNSHEFDVEIFRDGHNHKFTLKNNGSSK
jgi:SAM-dependent methyltransferase